MTKEVIQTYSLRVAQANQSELTTITLEIFMDYINDAVNCFKINDADEYSTYIDKAKAILSEIMAALNFENKVSFNLIKIYSYIYKTLIKVSYTPDTAILIRINGMVKKLHEAYIEVAKNDKSTSVMQNAEQLYAGLTYGKGFLNETSIRNDNDGWKA